MQKYGFLSINLIYVPGARCASPTLAATPPR